MPIAPAEFYRQARAWFQAGQQPDEVTIRSIVSRAYYAAILEARDRAGYREEKKDVHELTIRFYEGQKGIHYTIGKRLEGLRVKRVRADYYLTAKTLDRRYAEGALVDSRKVLIDLGVPDADVPL